MMRALAGWHEDDLTLPGLSGKRVRHGTALVFGLAGNMPLYSHYIAIDWSAANAPTRGANSIWWAERAFDPATRPTAAMNYATRAAVMTALRARIRQALASNERLLIGLDFAFGFPSGLAPLISGDGTWDGLWRWLAQKIQDQDNNRNNRFEVGAALNRKIGLDEGPFWGHPHQHIGRYNHLSPKAPQNWPQPFPRKRIVETRQTGAKSVFQLAYTGAVGSQSLLGIAALQTLRMNPEFSDSIAIWPFETHFDGDLSKPVIIVEIYPSAHRVDTDLHRIKDAAQVLSVVRDMAQWDRSGAMGDKLSAFGLTSIQRKLVLAEEGWIFGVA